MPTFEDLKKLFHHTVNNDPIDPGRGFVNLEIDGEIVYQYSTGGLHNFIKLEEGEYTKVKNFVDSLDYEVIEAEKPNNDPYNPEGTITIRGEDSAEADIVLFKDILNKAHFSLSDVDDAYFPVDENKNIRPEQLKD